VKAMILAAGLGTRLKPVTDKIPKALISINNTPLIELVIKKLIKFGIKEIIINVHHHAEQIMDFIRKKKQFQIDIEFSHEPSLLDTGGALKNAAWFFDDNKAFLLHNVDILSDLDLNEMLLYHMKNKATVTLAVRSRKTSRYLLFNEKNQFIGWKKVNGKEIVKIMNKNVNVITPFSFMGIHLISPVIFSKMPEKKIFPIIEFYLKLAQKGEFIQSFHADSYFWFDLGKPEYIEKAGNYLRSIQYTI
jgi:mannose-1-phosphate guanylyltransferase